jgi:hypothetical protein
MTLSLLQMFAAAAVEYTLRVGGGTHIVWGMI